MKTIEERAKYAQSQHKDESRKKFNPKHIMNFSDWEYGWCQGVTEQKAIDIDKACEWFANYLFEIGYPDDWVRQNGVWMNGAEKFRKAMED